MQNEKQNRLLLMQLYVGWDLSWRMKHKQISTLALPAPLKFMASKLEASTEHEWKVHGLRVPTGFITYMLCDAGHQQMAENILTAHAACKLEMHGHIANLLYDNWDWELLTRQSLNERNMAKVFNYAELNAKFPEVYRMLHEHRWLPDTIAFTYFISEMQLYTLIKSTTDIDLTFNDGSVPEVFGTAPMVAGISTNFALCLQKVNAAIKDN